MRRMLIAFAYFLGVVLIALLILVRYLERTSVFYPSKIITTTPVQTGLAYEDLYIKTSDGLKINAWLAKSSDTASTIIFAHGNTGVMAARLMRMKYWHDMGLNVVFFDYRGYGNSNGQPTEKGIYLDAQAVYDYLQSRKDIDHNRIIGYGASLGGVVMVDLATKRRLAALIIESSITSAQEMAHRLYPMLPSFLMSIKFDSISKIGKISCPKLILHGQQDHTIPFSMGQRLYEKAKEPKEFLEITGGHNDAGAMEPAVQETFKKFLKTYSLL